MNSTNWLRGYISGDRCQQVLTDKLTLDTIRSVAALAGRKGKEFDYDETVRCIRQLAGTQDAPHPSIDPAETKVSAHRLTTQTAPQHPVVTPAPVEGTVSNPVQDHNGTTKVFVQQTGTSGVVLAVATAMQCIAAAFSTVRTQAELDALLDVCESEGEKVQGRIDASKPTDVATPVAPAKVWKAIAQTGNGEILGVMVTPKPAAPPVQPPVVTIETQTMPAGTPEELDAMLNAAKQAVEAKTASEPPLLAPAPPVVKNPAPEVDPKRTALDQMTWAQLRQTAKGRGVPSKGIKRPDLTDAILAAPAAPEPQSKVTDAAYAAALQTIAAKLGKTVAQVKEALDLLA